MRPIGDGQPCFITFEAGATHDGLETAKKLATLAAEAKADAVKFQIVDPDRLIADRRQPFNYDVLVDRATGRCETVSEPLYDILRRRSMSMAEWRELKRHCDGLGLSFFATVTFEDELALVADMGCSTIKIASGDINHLPFIRKAARTGLHLQLDTGNATLGEIEQAVDVIRAEGNDNIIIHHCPSGYPAPPTAVNLRIIGTIKQMFELPVAYSDHSPGWNMTIAAIALGANLVEKTITFNRMIRSPEHVFSLEPTDASAFVRSIREIETAMGTSRRILSPEERIKRNAVRRSTFLTQAAAAGTALGSLKVEFRRPGHGLGPDEFERLAQAKLARDLPAGQMLTVADVV
jgi:sialic acid synthase SpsE